MGAQPLMMAQDAAPSAAPLSDGQRAAALLSVAEMYRADSAAIASGVRGETLMENAGAAVMREIRRRFDPAPTVVLCGPGNNGGDGFVIARMLLDEGWPVRVALLGDRGALKGDAALNAARWDGPVAKLHPKALDGAALVVDALFGAGLARPVDGMARTVIESVNDSGLPVVAVDVPSGVHGDDGSIFGAAINAVLTVTFFRFKPGHLVMPGRKCAGELVLADIGIKDSVLDDFAVRRFVNEPPLWRHAFPWPEAGDHKYTRGHVVVVTGSEMPGAARLATRSARRVGAGMVTVTAPDDVRSVFVHDHPGAIVEPLPDDARAFVRLLSARRRNAVLIGPGCGADRDTAERVLAALESGKSAVLDADALTVFQERQDVLFRAIAAAPGAILTPHAGEFDRLFGASSADKISRARDAAQWSGAVVAFKGADTVIAAPDGRIAINRNAPAFLATAGTGDVLAGLAVGLLAQGMPPFEAACASVWTHGAAAQSFGPGLIAEDLPEALPAVLRGLYDEWTGTAAN